MAKAIKEKHYGKARALPWILTHSQAAKFLAIQRGTTNKGHRTPGIDNKVWRTGQQKLAAIALLRRRGYKPQPLRRIYIRKKNGKVNFLHYADDFIVTGATKEILEQKVKPAIIQFLGERGLKLSEQKTVIMPITEGFEASYQGPGSRQPLRPRGCRVFCETAMFRLANLSPGKPPDRFGRERISLW